MKLVVDNPTQVPAKRAGKAHGGSPFLIAKLNSEGGAKNSVVHDFHRFLEARTATRAENIGQNGSDSKELQERPSDWPERNYLDTMPFGNLFDDLERRYEEDLKEADLPEFHKSDWVPVQDVKLIDARTLFANLRIEHEHANSSVDVRPDSKASSASVVWPGNAETPAVAMSSSNEKGATSERRNVGVEKHEWPLLERLEVGAFTPQHLSRMQEQPRISNAPAEQTDPDDAATPPKSAVTQGKPADANSLLDVSASRLGVPPIPAAAPSPMQQIVERVTKLLPTHAVEITQFANGQRAIRFTLQPESLGDVSVVLRMRDSGIDLAIRSERVETTQYLEDSKDELLQSLKLTGVDLGNVEIKPLETTASQDGRQDRSGAGQGGSHSGQFSSQHGGSALHGGSKENQWRAADVIAAQKGEKDETEQPETGGSVVGRGIVL